MTTQADKAARFRTLHEGPRPLLMPNPWDAGSARLFAHLGFEALATTSSGAASTLGKLDGGLTREEALDNAAAIVAAVDVPVSADLEDCFAREPEGVAETARRALATGVAGFSVEDFTRDDADPIHDIGLAAERVAAAAAAAHAGSARLVVTARAENHIHGRDDLRDTIRRLQRYQEAGADVLFAPGLSRIDDIREVVRSVDRPVSVLAVRGCPTVAELAEVGVRRVSVGGAMAFAALGAAADAARELLEQGTYGYLDRTRPGVAVARAAFVSS